MCITQQQIVSFVIQLIKWFSGLSFTGMVIVGICVKEAAKLAFKLAFVAGLIFIMFYLVSNYPQLFGLG